MCSINFLCCGGICPAKSTSWFASLPFSCRMDTGEVADGTSTVAGIEDSRGSLRTSVMRN